MGYPRVQDRIVYPHPSGQVMLHLHPIILVPCPLPRVVPHLHPIIVSGPRTGYLSSRTGLGTPPPILSPGGTLSPSYHYPISPSQVQGKGGSPLPSPGRGVSPSQVWTGGTPSCWWEGTSLGWSNPPALQTWEGGTPWTWEGVPHLELGRDTPWTWVGGTSC